MTRHPGRCGAPGMRVRSERLVARMLDAKTGAGALDVVDDLADPLPVAVICELFGVPEGDEARFHDWSSQLARAVGPGDAVREENGTENARTFDARSDDLADLIAEKRRRPRDDPLSGLATQATPTATGWATSTSSPPRSPGARPSSCCSPPATAIRPPSPIGPVRPGPRRHLGFGGGLHHRVGAPLGRFEADAAPTARARRLKAPHLTADPPPDRRPATLRGPEHLRVAVKRIVPEG